MKQKMISLVVMIVISTSLVAQESGELSALLQSILPGSVTVQEDGSWVEVYSDQLLALIRENDVSAAAIMASAPFCRNADEFPKNPLVAAFMVFELFTEAEALVRAGFSAALIQQKLSASWQKQLAENRALFDSPTPPFDKKPSKEKDKDTEKDKPAEKPDEKIKEKK